ncbi:hypothetical protein F5Y10DRAFT_267133 [Nemania abortiva]|nr:hypothetical protein F5Y10DRAFT_267133 [Nemania abortiva]
MANIISTTTTLLHSGDYSDFTIECEGQEFRVHKNIVCPQSPVIAAAMNGHFKEAKTDVFHVVEFTPATVKCMLDYMYTGKYEDMPPGCPKDNKDQEPTAESDNNHSAKITSPSRIWVHHGLVNCIADFFVIPDLAKMSIAAVHKLTHTDHWSADAFCDLLYATIEKTGDCNFRCLLATRAADHIGELTQRGLFNGSDLSDEISPDVIRLCAQRLDAMRSELEAATAGAARVNSPWPEGKISSIYSIHC